MAFCLLFSTASLISIPHPSPPLSLVFTFLFSFLQVLSYLCVCVIGEGEVLYCTATTTQDRVCVCVPLSLILYFTLLYSLHSFYSFTHPTTHPLSYSGVHRSQPLALCVCCVTQLLLLLLLLLWRLIYTESNPQFFWTVSSWQSKSAHTLTVCLSVLRRTVHRHTNIITCPFNV